jgi:reactive intermediate/imine deaminase
VLVANTTGTSPFSRVVQVGNLVFVAGQLGFKEGTRELVPGGVVPETKAALEAIGGYLAKAGLGLEDVAQCNVLLADIAEFQAMNEAYARFFPKEPPARTTAGISGLYGGARVEIDCTAAVR